MINGLQLEKFKLNFSSFLRVFTKNYIFWSMKARTISIVSSVPKMKYAPTPSFEVLRVTGFYYFKNGRGLFSLQELRLYLSEIHGQSYLQIILHRWNPIWFNSVYRIGFNIKGFFLGLLTSLTRQRHQVWCWCSISSPRAVLSLNWSHRRSWGLLHVTH